MSLAKHIPLNHAREYLRQHFAVASDLEPMNARPLGSNASDLDPDTRRMCLEKMDQCRERAHAELAGCINGAKIAVWGKKAEDGTLSIVAPDWACDCFDGKDGKRAEGLYFERDDFAALVHKLAPAETQAYFSENYGGLFHRQFAESVPQEPSQVSWSDFDASQVPELERLTAVAEADAWWSWPEAITWVGQRDVRNIATLRYW